MTEDEARDWIAGTFGVAAVDRLAAFAELIRAENQQQNLIAASTLDQLWARHIVDSAQLVPLSNGATGRWLDVGSGAGLPGLVVAILRDAPVTLSEPRRRRAAFLEQARDRLGLNATVRVVAARAETMPAERCAIISARAVATLDDIFNAASRHADADTRWILPKGQSAEAELAVARKSWHGSFHVEQSLTDQRSSIVLARGVRRR